MYEKLFFTIIGAIILLSWDKKEVVQQEKAPVLEQKTEIPKIKVETISESNIPLEMGAGCYYAKTEEEHYQFQNIALQDIDYFYMQINGALEMLEESIEIVELDEIHNYVQNKNYCWNRIVARRSGKCYSKSKCYKIL